MSATPRWWTGRVPRVGHGFARARRFAVGLGVLLVACSVALLVRSQGDGENPGLDEGLREPAAVAALRGGRLAVADHSADTVTVFDGNGRRVWVVARGLSRPSGLCADERGVWVADAGNHRVVLLSDGTGATLKSIPLREELYPTDVAVTGDGSLWVSASPNNLLILMRADSGGTLELDAVDGEPLDAPRGLIADGHGGVFVTEALAGRVRHLDAGGKLIATLGEFGVGEGRFAKPKDVAPLGADEIVVLDTHLGIIQVLGRDGTYRRLIARDGEPVQFEHPLGVAVLGDKLAVADAASGRVHFVDLDAEHLGPGEFPAPRSLLRTDSIADIDPAPLCRQCHDGTCKANLGNWDPGAYNHPMEMGDGVVLPADVSLTRDGDLRCLSCHGMHSDDEDPQPDLGAQDDTGMVGATAAVDRTRCTRCHDDLGERSAPGFNHVVMVPVPASANVELLRGNRQDLPTAITCRACHTPHGAEFPHLVVAPTGNGELCSACHAHITGDGGAHPLQVEVSPVVRASVSAVGGRLGSGGQLTCMTCHDPHRSAAGSLLRFQGGTEAACDRCHPDRVAFHTQGDHGVETCSRCHGMHGRVRPETGLCGECHEQHLVEASRGGHGRMACLECHPADGVLPAAGSLPEGTNPFSGRCLGCHDPGAAGGDAPRVANFTHPETHIVPAGGEWPSADAFPLFADNGDPLPNGVTGEFTCGSCHYTHGPDTAGIKELRRPAWKGVCSTCHGSDAIVRYLYFHQPR